LIAAIDTGKNLRAVTGGKKMKNLLIVGLLLGMASAVLADPPTKANITSRPRKGPSPGPDREHALHPGPVTNGVLGRAFQPGGNPLQMFNPKAPAMYGTAAQSLAIDPNTGKWNGIKLFEIIF
jgi:hypothetical protein